MNQRLFDVSDRVALVTGASSGIGRRLAIALGGAGAKVVLAARRESALRDTEQTIRTAGGQAATLPVDLSNKRGAGEIAKQAMGPFGDIDILVNAAGVNLRQKPEEVTIESWDQTLDLNLAVPFLLARELVPAMRARGWGRIINIASLQSARAFENGLAYGTSKGGVVQLTRAMAEAWSGFGVNCNAIAPGFFPTELTANLFADADITKKLASQTAIGRNGRMEDLDGPCLFLASPASDYVTGQVIYVDGGFTAK